VKKILCTLGPSSLNSKTINRLDQLHVDLFRINLSHTRLDEVENVINEIRKFSDTPICLDSEGAQVRTSEIENDFIDIPGNATIKIVKKKILGNSREINFVPDYIVDNLQEGDFVNIDFNAVLAQVIVVDDSGATLRILNKGRVGKNKAVTVNRPIKMPALTLKDEKAFKIGVKMGIKHFALSFANRGEDVEEVRDIIGFDSYLISKIECNNALNNLDDIIELSDAILIDRGDLSREQPIERIPLLQKYIIKTAKRLNKEVYVATNLLESMVSAPIPTRAEVNDIFNTLLDGADGLVLAAETAIGKYPIKAASMVRKLIIEFENIDNESDSFYKNDPTSLLVEPHGGKLVRRELQEFERDKINDFKTVVVKETELLDCEQIATGTYSPLLGFMNKNNLNSVLNDYKLVDGTIWPLPVVLQFDEKVAKDFSVGEKVVLINKDGFKHSMIEIDEIYSPDLEDVAKKWFGTKSKEHPGVNHLLTSGNVFISGNISLINKLPSTLKNYELSPSQTRFIFNTKGWSKVVGFHTRNVPHKAHQYIQMRALEKTHSDGLFISPVIGMKKKGDFTTLPILKSYQTLLDNNYYPEDKVIIGAFNTYSRYSGPREAVFTALCRKNMGCSHFIIGRDHTGVGNFYTPDANFDLFEKLGDIGIKPVFFDTVAFNKETNRYEETKDTKELCTISGTDVRKAFLNKDDLPEWFIAKEVQEVVKSEIQNGTKVFF